MSIKDEVFLGFFADHNNKLTTLATIAQPEIWASTVF